MNSAGLNPALPPLPVVGDDSAGTRDYPDRAAVIRASQRTFLAGLLSLSLPGIAWPLAACANQDLIVASTLSHDPLATRRTWPRHLAYALATALLAAFIGLIIGIAGLVASALVEGTLLLRIFHRKPPTFWNPARRHLYAGTWFSYLARLQFFTLLAVLLVFAIAKNLARP